MGGLLQEIPIPTWKWEDINMDFKVGLTRTQRSNDSIWVVVDRLTNFSHFILVKSTYSTEDYSRIFIDDIVCRHIRYDGQRDPMKAHNRINVDPCIIFHPLSRLNANKVSGFFLSIHYYPN